MADLTDVVMPLSSFSDQPVYNIKAICKRTGISAVTLRAWERRHGVPSPDRSGHGYRLYSERDLAILFWLRQQIQSGVNIGQAAHQLTYLLNNGHDPVIHVPGSCTNEGKLELNKPRSPDLIRQELIDALSSLDGQQAEHLLAEAAALYTQETQFIDILQSAVHTLYTREMPGPVNRLALNRVRQYLLNMLQMTPMSRLRQAIVVFGFADERSEIDLLILRLLLCRLGWPVVYLGNDLDPQMLGPALSHAKASMVVFYTDNPASAAKLSAIRLPTDCTGHKTHAVYWGSAIENTPGHAGEFPFEYLGNDLHVVLSAIVERLKQA